MMGAAEAAARMLSAPAPIFQVFDKCGPSEPNWSSSYPKNSQARKAVERRGRARISPRRYWLV